MTESAEAAPVVGRPRTRAAFWVGAGIFLSRLVGFLRERAFAYFFGASDYADAWRAATRAPNVIQNLLGEGTLSASFIPIYAELLEEGRDEEAGRFAGAILGLLLLIVSAVVTVGILLAPLVIPLMFFRWTPEKQDLTVLLVQILLPMTGILVISAWALGVLNSHRRFFVSYVAPVFWSLAQIVTLVGLGGTLAFGQERLVVALGFGAIAGALLQLGVQLPYVAGVLRHFRLSVGRAVYGVREAITNFIPVLTARGVVNLSAYLDLILAGLLASGAVAVLGYAQTFYVLPISLFGISVAASELPELSRQRKEAVGVLAERVSEALVTLGWFLVPSTVGYVVLGDVIVGALYQTGEFGPAETRVTHIVLAAYSLGLLASARSRLVSSAFYALRDTRTPARVAYVRVGVSLVIGAAAMVPLDRLEVDGLRLGAAGLALGASVGAWLEYALLRRQLSAAIGSHGAPGRTTARVWAAALAAVAASLGAKALLPALHPALVAVGTLVPFGVVYLVVTRSLGVQIPLGRRQP